MHTKRVIRIGLSALFIALGVILVNSCGGSFTVTLIDTLRPPAKEPVKQKPPAPVEKEKPQKPAQEPEIKVEEPKTEIVVSEETKATEKPEKSVSEETESVEVAAEGQEETESPERTGDSTGEKPSVSEEPEQKDEQKIAKEKEKKTKPSEAKKETVTITGIVSLRKNTFYITELESKKRYKLVGLKKEEEALLKKLIGKQADFELRIVSTEAKKAYNAQLEKILIDVKPVENKSEEPTPKKKK